MSLLPVDASLSPLSFCLPCALNRKQVQRSAGKIPVGTEGRMSAEYWGGQEGSPASKFSISGKKCWDFRPSSLIVTAVYSGPGGCESSLCVLGLKFKVLSRPCIFRDGFLHCWGESLWTVFIFGELNLGLNRRSWGGGVTETKRSLRCPSLNTYVLLVPSHGGRTLEPGLVRQRRGWPLSCHFCLQGEEVAWIPSVCPHTQSSVTQRSYSRD